MRELADLYHQELLLRTANAINHHCYDQSEAHCLRRPYRLDLNNQHCLSPDVLPLETNDQGKERKILHIPLTPHEKILCNALIAGIKASGTVNESIAAFARHIFPNRLTQDIQQIILHNQSQHYLDNYLLLEEKISTKTIPIPHTGRPSKLHPTSFYDYQRNPSFKQVFQSREASGSITSIAINRQPSIYGLKAIVGACALTDTTYNRPGETLFFDFDDDRSVESSVNCRILDGHHQELVSVSPGTSSLVLRSTVSAVSYDPVFDTFASVGYDGRLVVWDSFNCTTPLFYYRVPNMAPLNCLGHANRSPLMVFGDQYGTLYVGKHKVEETRQLECKLSTLPLVKKAFRKWANSVDHIAIGEDQVLALIGFHEQVEGGQLFSVHPGRLDCKTPLYSTHVGLSCMDTVPMVADNINANIGPMVALGTGGVIDNASGSGKAFLLDLRQAQPSATTISSPRQRDMDTIRFNPLDPTYLAISETSDNSVALFDLRHAQLPLLEYNHRVDGQEDCMMALNWLSDGQLVSGGMDGKIKLINPQQGTFEQSIKVIDLGLPINVITPSINSSLLFVGTDFGTVHCLSSNHAVAHEYASRYKVFYR